MPYGLTSTDSANEMGVESLALDIDGPLGASGTPIGTAVTPSCPTSAQAVAE